MMHPNFPRPIEVLRDTFGYGAFRDAQEEVVGHVVAGGDALVLMPTGSGKSLCYQIPSLVRRGTEIVARLGLADARVFTSSFDRPNIRYAIVDKGDARAQLLRFIEDEHRGEAGIVYCLSRRKVDEIAAWLVSMGVSALPYHAGMDT